MSIFKNPLQTTFYLILLFFIISTGYAQEVSELTKSFDGLSDKDKVEKYLEIGNLFSDKLGSADSLLFYSQKAYGLSKKINYKTGLLQSQINIAVAYQKLNQLDTSNFILQQLISLGEKKIVSPFLGDIYFNIGYNYFRCSNNSMAMENYLVAISNYKKNNDQKGLAMSYCWLATVLINENQGAEAEEYMEKSKELLPHISSHFDQLMIYSGLSGNYAQMGIQNKNYTDSTILYSKRALVIVNQDKYFAKGYKLYNAISDAYFLKGDYHSSLDYCQQSLRFRNFLHPGEIIISYMKFGDCFSVMGKHQLALTYLDSIKLTLPIVNDPYYDMEYYSRAYGYNKSGEKFLDALTGLEKYKMVEDSLYNIDKTTVINSLVQKYDKVENEKKINELSHENEIYSIRVKFLISGIVGAILVIVIIIFFFRQSTLRGKLSILEAEQRLSRARINPHFFFNALASLQSIATDEKKSKEISEYIHRFSKIMRESLESSFTELITIENEIEFLTHYLELQKLRTDGKFNYVLKLDDKIEVNELMIPGMILQPFIENSIEHGFSGMKKEGMLLIEFYLFKNSLKVIIVDNGTSLNEQKPKDHTSRAIQIIHDRLFILNKKFKTTSTFELTKIPDAQGTKVEIQLPLLYKK